MRNSLYLAFFLSGCAGLIYETIWSRYLGLFVGHTAYAQVIVLTIFLGGLSIGALVAGQRSDRIRRPLLWYAGAECCVGLYGLFFHDMFLALQGFAYSTLFPLLGESPLLTPAKWGLVGLLILPPSILLGTTFPLMSAGFLRLFPLHPGRVLSLLYFTNSYGAALGALVAGFILLGQFGLPGTVLVAAGLNVTVGLVAWGVEKRTRVPAEPGARWPETPSRELRRLEGLSRRSLWRLLLGVSIGTALASFIYEIAWIRMLSLVLGTATHSFEIMLSAFILGLALGAFWMRGRADRIDNPLTVLGWIQWIMGAAALATLPLYMASFGWTADLLWALNRNLSGYGLFNLFRYGVALLIMLPATFCAGMTLPLITRTLLGAGEGERAIGWVYGVNTLGSILGVTLASLVLMPLIGLKGLLIVGGGLDMALGVVLLGVTRTRPLRAAAGACAVVGVILFGVQWDRALLSSGVFRLGQLPSPDTEIQFYEDGRTATVSAFRLPPGVIILATNGKPDATLSEGWMDSRAEPDSLLVKPLSADEPTQVLLALITLAHNSDAQKALVIGQGSGLSSHMLLASEELESLVTVEIEPEMIEGSKVFLPATHRVFEDPRSRFVIDDAKSFLAAGGESLDLVLSEPSNPWVSGVSSLFTQEFYARVRDRLAPGGVFGQWIHLYEIDDGLVLSVLAGLHRSFSSYAVFLVSTTDMLIVAGGEPDLEDPDWGVFQLPGVMEDLAITFPFNPDLLESTRFLTREALAPLLDDWPQPNSDFFPVLDLGAERARFLQAPASGILESASGSFDFSDIFSTPFRGSGETLLAPVPQIPMARTLALRNRTRKALSELSATGWEDDLEVQQALHRYQRAGALMSMGDRPVDWQSWVRDVLEGAGWTPAMGWTLLDDTTVQRAIQAAGRLEAPDGVLAALEFVQALDEREWAGLVSSSDVLASEVEAGRRWISPGVVLEAGVAGRILTGRPREAEEFFQRLSALSDRSPWDFRTRLLQAHLDQNRSPR